jgi:hypothetical protein
MIIPLALVLMVAQQNPKPAAVCPYDAIDGCKMHGFVTYDPTPFDPGDAKPNPPYGSDNFVILSPLKVSKFAEWSEKITKDGHFVMTFDDPNNEWRCWIGSRNNEYDPTAFTVICGKNISITDERTTP